MNNAIRRSCISMFITVFFMMMCLLFGNVLTAKAAETPYYMPVTYMNQYVQTPSESGEDGMNTANIEVTLSTDSLQKGTVVTVSGIPTDCINFQEDDNYTVVISEGDAVSTTYGGWYDGKAYDNGTLSYTVQTDEPSLSIAFGQWRMKDASGQDACYVINADGSIEK